MAAQGRTYLAVGDHVHRALPDDVPRGAFISLAEHCGEKPMGFLLGEPEHPSSAPSHPAPASVSVPTIPGPRKSSWSIHTDGNVHPAWGPCPRGHPVPSPRYSRTVPARWCDSNISTAASSRFTCSKRRPPLGPSEEGTRSGWGDGVAGGPRDGWRGPGEEEEDAGGFGRRWMKVWGGTHRVGEMSHGFNVEQLLKYQLQLVLRALGRPGRRRVGKRPP